MIIALDYDGTYTADPALWDTFIQVAHLRGHQVHIVTMRHESEPVCVREMPDRIHYTDRRAKKLFMEQLCINVQIWVDDRPDFILHSATPRELNRVSEGPLDWSGA